MTRPLPPPSACERARELCARGRLRGAVVRCTCLARAAARERRCADVLRRAAQRGAPGREAAP